MKWSYSVLVAALVCGGTALSAYSWNEDEEVSTLPQEAARPSIEEEQLIAGSEWQNRARGRVETAKEQVMEVRQTPKSRVPAHREEEVHQIRIAKIERMEELAFEKRDHALLEQCSEMRRMEMDRHARAMQND